MAWCGLVRRGFPPFRHSDRIPRGRCSRTINIRGNKMPSVHISIRSNPKGNSIAGLAPRAGICNILREQSSSRDYQCMRSRAPAPNDIYIYIDTALDGILNNGGMLKCICDHSLTTELWIFSGADIGGMRHADSAGRRTGRVNGTRGVVSQRR